MVEMNENSCSLQITVGQLALQDRCENVSYNFSYFVNRKKHDTITEEKNCIKLVKKEGRWGALRYERLTISTTHRSRDTWTAENDIAYDE